ncbi:hypothetical protein JCM17960_17120 [Magnetospira thiophila]
MHLIVFGVLGLLLAIGSVEALAAPLKPGDVFKDCPDCPEMVVIPAGSFMMGFDQPPRHIISGEYILTTPVHRVTIPRPFAMGRYEVTVKEFLSCRDTNLCWVNNYNRRLETKKDMPAVYHTYLEMLGFLHWLEQSSKHRYRLPSEAEWEYAARGGTTTRYWWGDEFETGRMNCSVCLTRGEPMELRSVGTFPPNPFGLYDMLGNVDEWVSDCWNNSYIGAPEDGSFRLDGDCFRGTRRGASWRSSLYETSVFYRGWNQYFKRDVKSGFRVVRDLTDAELGLVEGHQTP